ncbi:MAG: histidine kinase dimerization/phospho-acceptor domain-containing protein [Myxococcota bacterium]|nr:histidine kinase dimerization/phospho-acceptor domain-containing protein [Myxococcota bacterium]
MLTIWIIHRDARHRAALARMVGAGDGTVLGGPMDPVFASATRPNAILLGLSSDFEQELDFVQRFGSRFEEATWILLSAASDQNEATRLFDTLQATHLPYPTEPTKLRQAVRAGLRQRRVQPLSIRTGRRRLTDRFGRWFQDVDLPDLMRSLDPRLARVPVLIRGERGSGRSLLARYLHTFGGESNASFLSIASSEIHHAEELLQQLAGMGQSDQGGSVAVWLEDVDLLPSHVQRTIRDWIEFGPPSGRVSFSRIRWMAGAAPEADFEAQPGLDPQLAETLSALSLELPALRDRADQIPDLVARASAAWCQEQGEAVRTFNPESLSLLGSYPWPGNLHELESVVTRSLSFTAADPIAPVHLRFPTESRWLDQLEGQPEARINEVPLPENQDVEEDPIPEGLLIEEEELVLMGEPIHEDPESDATTLPEASEAAETQETEAAPALTGFRDQVEASDESESRGQISTSELRRIVNAVAHEVRNPLVSIRTFSQLLPEQYEDSEFRERFSELVDQDVTRIDEAVSRLQSMVDLPTIQSETVDLSHLLDKLLDEYSAEIRERRLLVLKELDHRSPHVIGDPLLLRDAFSGLLSRTLSQVGDRGDIYIASKHSDTRLGASPSLRVLLRYTAAEAPSAKQRGDHGDLEGILAQTIIQSLGGSFTLDTTDGEECVIVIDLPAPTDD